MGDASKIIELIKEISKFHPAAEAGRKRGWSSYTGGMADTGHWHILTMLDAHVDQLKQCLLELIEEFKPKPPRIYTEEEQRLLNTDTYHKLPNGSVVRSNALEDKEISHFFKEHEMKLLWG